MDTGRANKTADSAEITHVDAALPLRPLREEYRPLLALVTLFSSFLLDPTDSLCYSVLRRGQQKLKSLNRMKLLKKKKSVWEDSREILSVLPLSTATTGACPVNSYLNIQNTFHSLYVSASKLLVLVRGQTILETFCS